MDELLCKELASAVVLAMGRVDLPRADQIAVLEMALEWLRLTEQVDESALLQIVGLSEAN
jgi:hypothetical protein